MARINKTDLMKLQKKLKTDAAIGEQFGITRQAVHQLRKKYGIDSSLASNPERNTDIVNLYEEGKSGTDIAKKYDLSISQTYRIINETKQPAKKAASKVVAKKAASKVASKVVEKKAASKVVEKKAASKVVAKKAASKVVEKKVEKKTSKKK